MNECTDTASSAILLAEQWATVLSPFTALLVAYLTIVWSNNRQLNLLSRTRNREAIDNFYQPILSLIGENRALFENFGPPTWSSDENKREIDSKTWSLIRERWVKKNNESISRILSEQFSYALPEDSFDNYYPLIKHIRIFAIFHEHPTEKANVNRFPVEIEHHLQKMATTAKENL